MKARILGQTNKSDNFPLFSTQEFQKIQTIQGQKEYLLQYLQFFITRLDLHNTQRQKIIPSMVSIQKSFKDFSEVLSHNYSILLPDNFESILQILPIEYSILEMIPNSSNFLQIVDLILYQTFQHSDSNIKKSSSNAILALFSSKLFCQSFVDSGKYVDTLISIVDFANSQLIHFFFDLFLNDNFIQYFIEKDILKYIDHQRISKENVEEDEDVLNCSKFTFSFFEKIFFLKTTKDNILYKLIEFGSKFIVNIFTTFNSNNLIDQSNQIYLSNLFIKNLSKLGLFEKANNFFIFHHSLNFMPMFYNNLLLNLSNTSNNKEFNPTVMKYLNSLYKNEKFRIEDGRVVVMHFFHTLNINYFLNEKNFRILDWINDSFFKSSALFQVTSSFLSKCVYYDISFLTSFIDFFIEKVSPPAQKDFVYNEIFSWFLSLISLLFDTEDQHTNEEKLYFFDIRNFLSKIFYEPSISDVSYYLIHFFNFKQLLLHISILGKDGDKRNTDPRKIFVNQNCKIVENTKKNELIIQINDSLFDDQYFSRIIELIEFNKNEESLQEFFLNYLKNSFGKKLVLYFFKNISSSKEVQNLLYSFAQEFTEQLIEIIVSFKLLDGILENINDDISIPLFKIFNSIAIKTNNHFFDDYLIHNIQLNSPICKLNYKKIEKFILPAFQYFPIPIPSLVPLLIINNDDLNKEKLDFKSPYNHYLLGNYALPIYNKLKIPVSKIPCLQEIVNQFIRFNDFCYIFQNGPRDASMAIQTGKQPEFPFNIFEIFPSENPESILLNITSPFTAFKIRFESKYHLPTVLFNINGSPFLFVKDDFLIDISNTSLKKIELSRWYMISFLYNKNLKNISIGIDSEIVSTLLIASKDSNYIIDSIGSLQKPTSIHYMIMNTLAIGNSIDQINFSEELATKYFKPQGKISFVPNYSFHRLFDSRFAFSRFCEIIETSVIVKNKNDSLKNRRKSIVKFINESEKRYHDKAALFVSLMSSWILSNNISSEWYLNRYRYCLMQNIDYCEPFYLTSILQTIINLNDKITRTKLFYYFICDYFFWTKFPERIVGQCLDFINNFIDDFSASFDLKILEETKIGDFLFSLTYFFKNSFILNGLLRFLETLLISFDEKYVVPLLSNFAMISKYLNVNEMEMIFDFEKGPNLNYSTTIISFANDFRKKYKMKIFKVEELFTFALLVNNQQLAINFIMNILHLCDSDQFVQQYMSLLCRIVSRFPFNNLIWQKLFQLLMNDKSFVLSFGPNSNLNQYNFSNGIRVSILPLILSALIPLFNEESKFSDNIKIIVFQLLRENQHNLISKNTIKIFSAFLQGSILGIVDVNSVNQTVFPNPKVKDFYVMFIDELNRIFYSSKKPNSSFIQYTSMLLSSILILQNSSFKRFSLVLNIAVHASNYFLIQMLSNLFSSYIHTDLTNQQLSLLNDISLFALMKEEDIKLRNGLSNSVFVYCIQNHERFVYFAKFFVFSYNYVSNDVKYRTLRAFQMYFDIQSPKAINDIIPYLYVVLCTDINEVLTSKTKDKINEIEPIQKVENSPKSIVKNARNRRLLNKKESSTTTSRATMNDSENDSSITNLFSYKLYNYILTTFKQFPKDSKLSLLLKYKDINELECNKDDLQQIKSYISTCMKTLQDEALNCYKVVELKGNPLPQDNLGIFLFSHFSDAAQRSKNFFNYLLSDMNFFLRHIEKYYGSFIYINNTITSQNLSFENLNANTKSYHISPFYFPGFCSVVLIPSPFSIFKNVKISKPICSANFEVNLFGLEKESNFVHSKEPDFSQFSGYFDYQNKAHKMKISFNHNTNSKTRKLVVYYHHLNMDNQQQQNILSFISIYGRPLQILNCSLIRKFINIPAVLFKYKERYLILSNCQFDGKEVNFIDTQKVDHDTQKVATNEADNDANTIQKVDHDTQKVDLNCYESFLQSVYLNEFGQFYLFCGRPVLLIRLSDIIISHQCTDDSVTWSVGIFSCLNGSFVLSFTRENIALLQQSGCALQDEAVADPPSIYKLNTIEASKQGMLDNWLSGRVSNVQYITLLNLLSGRSFDDLSSYPIVPRVLASFDGSSFGEDYRKHLRNLQFPVSVLSEHLKSKSRFELSFQSDSNTNSDCAEEDRELDIDDDEFFCNRTSFAVDLSDPCFDTLKMRYEVQKYHNCENISNGSVVSFFLIRVPPFLNYSLQFNDGSFDAADRVFSSISLSCGINKFSTSELVPELFLLPEMLTNNFNRIEFPEGVSGDVVLPKWSYMSDHKSDTDDHSKVKIAGETISSYNFVEMHRRVLESLGVRMELSKWIDLVFGFKQSGEEAVNSLNLYNPLSYQSSIGSAPLLSKSSPNSLTQIRTMRADFVKNSGQMPLKIFTSPHQQYSSIPTFSMGKNVPIAASASFSNYMMNDKKSSLAKKTIQKVVDKKSLFGFTFEDILVHFNQFDNIDRSYLNRLKGTISIHRAKNTFKLFNPDFFNAINCNLSKRGEFLAVTFCTSKVKIFRLFYFCSETQNQINSIQPLLTQDAENSFSFAEQSVFSRDSVYFSVVNDRQFICASACKEEVILWSIINGFIIHIIPLKDVKCITFDEELNLIYIGAGSEVHQFSINGLLLRTIKTSFEDVILEKNSNNMSDNKLEMDHDCVESLAVGGFGFSYDNRFVAVGKRSGNVSIYKQNRETLDFELVSIFEVSSYPIVKLIANQNNFVVEAFDSYNSLPTVF